MRGVGNGAPADVGAPWVINRATAGGRALQLGEVWQYRELAGFLALRDLKVRYKQAAFGVAWAVLQPLAGAVVLTLVFRRLADVPSDGIPYPVFAVVGFVVWSYFSSSLNGATQSLVGNAALVTKVYFPRLAAPIAAVLPSLVDLAVGLAIVAAFMVAYGVAPGPALVTLPFWVLTAVVAALGTGLLLATLTVRFRDTRHAFPLLTQLWFFASPVAYPSSMVDGAWRYPYHLNPMVGVLDGFRWALIRGPAPDAADLLSLVSALVLLAAGLRYFRSAERRFADVI